jgi:hypothetical protein
MSSIVGFETGIAGRVSDFGPDAPTFAARTSTGRAGIGSGLTQGAIASVEIASRHCLRRGQISPTWHHASDSGD